MGFLLKKNHARTTINESGGINASVLSVEVTDASQLPLTGDFLLTIWDSVTHPDPADDSNAEIVKVTGVSGNILTIVRGQEDTVGTAHANGNIVASLITAGTFEEIENAIAVTSNLHVIGEDLTSQIDGIKTVFTTANNYASNTTAVYVNGIRLRRGFDYTEETANTVKIPIVVTTAEIIVVDYYQS